MTNDSPNPSRTPLRIFGVGDTGLSVIQLLIQDGVSAEACVAVNTESPALDASAAHKKVRLETKRLRGLGSGGDPERGRQAAEERVEELQALCQEVDVVFIIGGLGGGSGTGIGPVLARLAKSAGSLVLAFVTLPFECEGTRRQSLAEEGLDELKAIADGVVCLPNQNIFKLIEENTTVLETFKITNRLLADGVQGLWRLLSFKGLIEIPLEEICGVLQDRHSESAFAVAEASGPGRSEQMLTKLFAHPMLEEGRAITDAEVVLVSLTGGTDLTITEVNRVMEQIKLRCESAQVLMGACIDEQYGNRLAATLITSKKPLSEPLPTGRAEALDSLLLERKGTAKPNSRFLPPPPTLGPEQVQRLLSRQARGKSGPRKGSSRMRQTQLPLEIVSKGRFDKSEPTIHKGEDLDVPTYIRRGVPLN
jgi:cell division protein FtsZ